MISKGLQRYYYGQVHLASTDPEGYDRAAYVPAICRFICAQKFVSGCAADRAWKDGHCTHVDCSTVKRSRRKSTDTFPDKAACGAAFRFFQAGASRMHGCNVYRKHPSRKADRTLERLAGHRLYTAGHRERSPCKAYRSS